jgi:threonine dehydrogenase-like Zn-dependent dehydrogenase
MSKQAEYAVTFTARERAELVPFEREESPLGPREVAGRTLATLISAGTELAGGYLGSSFPSSPGYAAVFRVEEVGEGVSDLAAGDLAYCMGRHRSWQREARERMLPVPSGLAAEAAVFARLMGVSMSTLTTTTARPPAKVIVTGLGLVGHLAAKIFAACGYEVTACDPSPTRQELAVEGGIARVLPAVPVEDPEYAREVALVVECSGHEQAVLKGLKVVQKRGEVSLVGAPWRRQTELTAHEILHQVFHHYVVLRSGWEWELPLSPTEFRTAGNSIFGNYEAALRWLAEGRVSVEGLYSLVPPREAQEAYQGLLHQRMERLAVVFDWTRG